MENKPLLTARHIRDLLRTRYSDTQQWHLAFEVRNTTGAVMNEAYGDAIAMNLWPSRGFAIHGFEIKVSRADWLRELEHPDKADKMAAHCDYWWLVAPRKIVHESELPLNWGFLAATEKRLTTVRDARFLSARDHESNMYRGFAASLMRRSRKEDSVFREEVDRIRAQCEHEMEVALADQEKRLMRRDDLDKLRRFKKDFEEAFGDRLSYIHKDDGGKKAERVRRAYDLVRMCEDHGLIGIMRSHMTTLRRNIDSFSELFDADPNTHKKTAS